MITVSNVSVQFGKRVLFNDVNRRKIYFPENDFRGAGPYDGLHHAGSGRASFRFEPGPL